MPDEDRFSIEEFARRYRLAEDQVPAFCERHGVSPEAVVSREEFKGMLDAFNSSPDTPSPEPQAEAKEEKVAKKQTLERWAQDRKLTHPRVAVLCNAMGWTEKTKITEAELQAAIDRHLLNKQPEKE